MTTYRITLEYEGTRYSGWQTQSNTQKTIQGKLQQAAAQVFGNVELGGAGRTDAGVHAAAQVAHLRIRKPAPPLDISRKLNDLLPHDINILSVEEVHDGFHARHDAEMRFYLYQIATRRTAFAKPFVWWIKDRLDPAAMERCGGGIVGTHDFKSLCDRRAGEESTLVAVSRFELKAERDLILIRIGASHFLWKMVRKIISALAEVGRGAMTQSAFEALMERPGDARYSPTAPPSGLFLEAVTYEGEVFERVLEAIVPLTPWAPRRSIRARSSRR